MLNLKDFNYLAQVEPILQKLVQDRPGLIIVAGLEPRRVAVERSGERWVNSGRSAILRVLMREYLTAHAADNCLIVTADGTPFRAPREFRGRIRNLFTGIRDASARLAMAIASETPDLFVFEQFEPENIGVMLDAVQKGARVLTQIDSVFRGAGLIRHLQSLGLTTEQLYAVSWVVSVQRVPTICQECKQAYTLAAEQARLVGFTDVDGDIVCYRAAGCEACHSSGHEGEVTVFDFFHSDTQSENLFDQISILPVQEYLRGLVRDGQISLEDALNYESKLLHDTYTLLASGEKSLLEANTALQSKVLELEVSNRILLQRTEALISLQDIGQTLTKTSGLEDVAHRVCHHVRGLCGADRAVVYYKQSDELVVVLAFDGWSALIESQPLDMTHFPEAGVNAEPKEFPRIPPGILVTSEKEKSLARVGMSVPLVAQERLVGVMIVHSTLKTAFKPGDVAMLRSFANQAALAMQRADLVDQLRAKIDQLEAAQAELVLKERMAHELELARQVQQSVLPKQFPLMPGYAFAAHNEPARRVGGDFYDVVRLDEDHFGIVIADVSDKGMPAALYMALARSLILAEAHRENRPEVVLNNVNHLLLELGEPGMFVTVFYGVVERRAQKLRYARGGHDRPFIVRGGDEMFELDGQGMALGIYEGEQFAIEPREFDLQVNDRLVLFTDGLQDVESPQGERYGAERLASLWKSMGDLPVDEFCSQTFEKLTDFMSGADQADDMTLLIVGVR